MTHTMEDVCRAIENDDEKTMGEILAGDFDFSTIVKNGKTAIAYAAFLDNFSLVQQIANARKASKSDQYGHALYLSFKKGWLKTSEALIKANTTNPWQSAIEKDNCIHAAVRNNHAKLIPLGCDRFPTLVNEKNAKGETPLQLAASLGNWECVNSLLENHNKFDLQHLGEILVLATKARQVKTVELLIGSGAPIDTESKDEKYTPLHWAAKNKDEKITILLLSKNANPVHGNPTPLELAFDNFDHNVFNLLTTGTIINKEIWSTLLFKAIKGGNLEQVAIFATKETVNKKDLSGNTPLHAATLANQSSVISLLISKGADQSIVNSDNLTPIELACSNLNHNAAIEALLEDQHFSQTYTARKQKALAKLFKGNKNLHIAKLLLRNGANVNEQDFPSGNTALHYFLLGSPFSLETGSQINQTSVSFLMEGFDPTIENSDGKTVFEIAASKSAEQVRILLEKFGNEKPCPLNYRLGLESAIAAGNYATCKLILEQESSSCRNANNLGNPALHLAITNNLPKILELLLENGADPETRNHNSRNMYELARDQNKTACITVLETFKRNKQIKSQKIERFEKKGQVVKQLFDELLANGVPQRELEDRVNEILNRYREGLKDLVPLLDDKIASLSKITVNPSLTASHTKPIELIEYKELKLLANSLLNSHKPFNLLYPEIEKLKKSSIPEAQYILDYLLFLENVVNAKERFEAFINTFSAEMYNRPWKIWSRKGWIEGVPTHINELKRKLMSINIDPANSCHGIGFTPTLRKFNAISASVTHAISNPTSRRDADTTKFYQRYYNQLKNITFSPGMDLSETFKERSKEIVAAPLTSTLSTPTMSVLTFSPAVIPEPMKPNHNIPLSTAKPATQLTSSTLVQAPANHLKSNPYPVSTEQEMTSTFSSEPPLYPALFGNRVSNSTSTIFTIPTLTRQHTVSILPVTPVQTTSTLNSSSSFMLNTLQSQAQTTPSKVSTPPSSVPAYTDTQASQQRIDAQRKKEHVAVVKENTLSQTRQEQVAKIKAQMEAQKAIQEKQKHDRAVTLANLSILPAPPTTIPQQTVSKERESGSPARIPGLRVAQSTTK